jgi:hypothetical protein
MTENKSVYCAVRTEYLDKVLINFRLEGRAMAEAAGCRPLASEACVLSRVSQRKICCGECGIDTGFSPSSSVPLYFSTGAPY